MIEDTELQNKAIVLIDVASKLCNVQKNNALARAAYDLCIVTKNKREKLYNSVPT